MLGWSPSEFWEATPSDLCSAVMGRVRAAGPQHSQNRAMGDDGLPLAPGCTREGTLRVLEQMRAEREAR